MQGMQRIIALVVGGAVALGTSFAQAKPKTADPIVVRGGWVNDAPCVLLDPASVQPGPGSPPSEVSLTCTGTTTWNGGFAGKTVIIAHATVDAAGNISGTADEWFYGIYTPTNSLGSLAMFHRFSIDGTTGGFLSEMTILGGTCAFEGSTGRATFLGNQYFGGYEITWILSGGPGPTDPTCSPVGDLPADSLMRGAEAAHLTSIDG